MRLRQLSLVLGLLLVIGVWGACVEIPNGPGTIVNPDFRSQARFVHTLPSPAGAVNIKVDGVTIGNIALGAATGYSEIASGTRSVGFGDSAAQNLSFGSEQQSTFAAYLGADGKLAYLNLLEGHKDKNNGKAGTAKVKFVNLATGSANVSFRSDSVNSTDLRTAVTFASAPQYTEVTPGSRAIYAVSNGGYLVSEVSGAKEVPPVSGNRSSGDATADLVIDALAFVVNVKADNNRGVFTQAHIHNGADGVAAPVVFPMSVDSQNVSFSAPATISGANEPTPVTTTSTGTGRFHFNSKNGLFYNISITRDNNRGFFTGGHFHRGPVGVNGPVVFGFPAVATQTIVPPVDSLRGRNEPAPADTNSKAGGLGTFTLYRDSLVYSIVVARRTETTDTTFTAMHFHNAAAGSDGPVVKDLAAPSLGNAPWSNTSRTFTGTWKRTDTQPLTDALIAELIAGRIYLNAHTPVRPGGAIRSQLKNVPTSTFALSGSWNDATLTPALKDSMAKGLFYVNFHTAANPGGEIRAQCVPDTFTVSTFRGTWNIPRDSTRLKEEFNLGRMYFNFHTLANPGGEVRGQIKVDASKGQYSSVRLNAATYEDGKMYTVIATGKGATFQMITLSDRQVPGTPVGKPKAIDLKKEVVNGD